MAKNEAKIRFTAETGEFNSAIKRANSELTELRAEMKLNDAQMDRTGASAEGLENKHRILAAQLSATEDKTAALSQKVDKAAEIFGENSDEVSKLRTQLLKSQTAEERIRQAIDSCNDELRDQGSAAREADGGFTILKGTLADLASSGIQAALSAITDFGSYMAGLPQETMEFRQDFATLTTSFDKMGLSTEQATNTWKDLYAVFGEDDRAVETANHIAKMAKSQEDLNAWTTITTGVWATYQDSLPVEGLAEASMETAKTGQVTGVLADALNWGAKEGETFGVKLKENTEANAEWNEAVKEATTAEEFFNLALQECTTEQERQQLITDTLNSLYGEAAETYRDTSSAQMELKEAQAEQEVAEANLATAIEPVTTAFTNMKTEIMEGALPAVQGMSDGILDMIGWAKEHPAAMQAMAYGVGVLTMAIAAYNIAQNWAAITTAITTFATAAWGAVMAFATSPITLVVLAIGALIAIGVALYKNWDTVKAKCSELWSSVKEKFSSLKEAVVNKVTELKDNAVEKFNSLKSSAIEKVNSLKTSAVEKFNNLKSEAVEKVNSLKTSAAEKFAELKGKITKPVEDAKKAVGKAVDKIKGFFDFEWSLPQIKLPHFSVSGGEAPWGFMGKGSLPKVSVSWYKEGGIMTRPTIFGFNGNTLLGGGEAGPEAILPIDKLEGYVENAIERSMNVVNMQSLADAIDRLADRAIELKINDRTIATATASANDSVNGLRSTFKNRGLAL